MQNDIGFVEKYKSALSTLEVFIYRFNFYHDF